MTQGRTSTGRRNGRRAAALIALAAGTAVVVGSAACAQTMSSSGSQFNRGYGFSAGELNNPVNVATRDAGGNRVFVDGVTQLSADQSVFSSAYANGAVDAYSGAGVIGGSASAIGNNLQVTVSGNYNTVIVNSKQINNGDVSATTVLNGKVNLDGQ